MKRFSVALSTAMALALSVGLAAQSSQTQPPTPQSQQPAATAQGHQVTVEGCLFQEKDVPGRQPNVAERTGVMEDYILTAANFVKGEVPGAPKAAAAGDPAQPVGTSGSEPMYEVVGLDDERLKPHVGKRVQIEGSVDPKDFEEYKAAKERGEPLNDLPEIRATSIREGSGECRSGK
jgi:hypothetical protein